MSVSWGLLKRGWKGYKRTGGRHGLWENRGHMETRLIKVLRNPEPPGGEAMPDLPVPLSRFRVQMLRAHILCHWGGKNWDQLIYNKINFMFNMKGTFVSLSPISQNGVREKPSKSQQAVGGFWQMATAWLQWTKCCLSKKAKKWIFTVIGGHVSSPENISCPRASVCTGGELMLRKANV